MEEKNVIISKEYSEKIRLFAAIQPDETFEYVPVIYREFEESLQPKFTLRPVSGEQILRFSDEMSGDVQMINGQTSVRVKRGSFVVNIVKAGLVSWRNFYDENGKIIDFEPGAFSCLQRKLLEELSDAILSRTSLKEEEVLGLK